MAPRAQAIPGKSHKARREDYEVVDLEAGEDYRAIAVRQHGLEPGQRFENHTLRFAGDGYS